MNDASLLDEMIALGWRFTAHHLILTIRRGGRCYRVALPIEHVDATVGACFPAGVGFDWGAPEHTSVGFWKKLTRSVKKAVRPIVPKAIRRATASLERTADRAIQTAAPIAKSIVKSKALTTALTAASFVPGLQAIAIPSLAAQQAARQALVMAERGYQATKQIAQGARTAHNLATQKRGLLGLNAIKRLAAEARTNPRAAETIVALQRQLGAR